MHRFFSFVKKNSIIFLLILIIGIGAYIRFTDLGQPSLWIDEGYSINASQQILVHGKPLLESGELYTNQPLASYFIAGSIKIFGFDPYNPWSTRLPSAIFGVLNILLVFLFTKRLFDNNWIALGSAFFVAFFPWEIAWSRQARGYTMLQFFLLLSFDHILAFIQERKIRHALLGSIAFVFAYFSHNLAVAFLPGIFMTIGLWMLLGIQTISWKKSWPFLLLSLFAIALGQSWLQRIDIINYISFYNEFIWNTMPWIFGFGVLGFLFSIFQKRYIISGILLLGTTTIAYIIIASYGATLQYRYLVPLIPFIGIGCMYVFFYFFSSIVSLSKKYILYPLASCIAFFVFCVFLVINEQAIFYPTSQLDKGSPQPDFNHAYEYIMDNKSPYHVIISPYAHMTNIYLGDPGILLPVSLTGRSKDLDLIITNQNTDYYTNAPTMKKNDIVDFMHTHSGYILLDSMAAYRIPEMMQIIQSQKLQLVFSKINKDQGIWVFAF